MIMEIQHEPRIRKHTGKEHRPYLKIDLW